MHVIDKRHVTTARECFNSMVEHVREAVQDGVIKTVITLFPPCKPDSTPIRIWNGQIFAYAGYRDDEGNILGEPAQVEFTECLIKLGWEPPDNRTGFDVLPIAIQASENDLVEFFELPRDVIHE
eukprot:Pgem_evm1s11475